MYLWRPLRLHERNGIFAPCAPQILFELLLAGAYPRGVVALCDSQTLMPEQNGDTFQRHTGEKQLHCECVPESVCMATGNFRQDEQRLKPPLPLTNRAVQL